MKKLFLMSSMILAAPFSWGTEQKSQLDVKCTVIESIDNADKGAQFRGALTQSDTDPEIYSADLKDWQFHSVLKIRVAASKRLDTMSITLVRESYPRQDYMISSGSLTDRVNITSVQNDYVVRASCGLGSDSIAKLKSVKKIKKVTPQNPGSQKPKDASEPPADSSAIQVPATTTSNDSAATTKVESKTEVQKTVEQKQEPIRVATVKKSIPVSKKSGNHHRTQNHAQDKSHSKSVSVLPTKKPIEATPTAAEAKSKGESTTESKSAVKTLPPPTPTSSRSAYFFSDEEG